MPVKYSDWWWDDLPTRAQKAAKVLGYEHKSDWDVYEKDVPYDAKDFKDCTQKEKQAALLLGNDPMDKLEEVWWEDLDEVTKLAATILGFDQQKWDDDWEIDDLPCEKWHWIDDMTKEQRQAARYFGYDRCSWDEEDCDNDDDGDDDFGGYESDDEEEFTVGGEVSLLRGLWQAAASVTAAAAAAPTNNDEGKSADGKNGKKRSKSSSAADKPKVKFSATLPHGGDGGAEFDHGNHRTIQSLTVRAGGSSVVDGILVVYNDASFSEGGEGGAGAAETLTLGKGEYITEVSVRSDKLVQSLTFTTNKGNVLGPCGGKGALEIDKKGGGVECKAPPKAQLCGLKGRGGKYLDAVAFRWGPIPKGNPGK